MCKTLTHSLQSVKMLLHPTLIQNKTNTIIILLLKYFYIIMMIRMYKKRDIHGVLTKIINGTEEWYVCTCTSLDVVKGSD